MAKPPILPAQLDPTARGGPGCRRLIFIVALAALTGLLMTQVGGPYDLASRGLFQPPSQVTIPADIIYRISTALPQMGYTDSTKSISPRQLEQMALALYEQNALSENPSAAACHRLAIFYAKSGYTAHAQELFLEAAQLDETHKELYLLLSQLYADEPADEAGLLGSIDLLEQQDRWLAGLTKADLYRRVGQVQQAAQLRADWEQRQVIFATITGSLLLVYLIAGLAGLVILLSLAISWAIGKRKAQRRRRSWVPWHLTDVVEAIVVLLFLMVCLALGTALIRRFIGIWFHSEIVDAILMGVSYVLATAGTIALIIYRIGVGRSYWNLLGVRVRNVFQQVGQGLAGYAVFVGLLMGALVLARVMGAGGIVPLARSVAKAPTELLTEANSLATLAIYFVLVAIIGPIVEEIIFRGFVYAGLRRIMPVLPAALGSAFIFAGVHISAPVGGLVVIGLIGVVLAYLYERTDSLLPTMVTHSLYNTFVFLILATHTLV